MDLQTVWFALIAVLWIGYFVLDGFDLGVGMLLPVIGKDDLRRRVMINSIATVWDGNEVWLLVAGGATFAAFPLWYATMFSGFYLALFLVLRRPDPARRGVRVPRQARLGRVAQALGLGHRGRLGPAGPALRRGLRQRRQRHRRSSRSPAPQPRLLGRGRP